MTKVRCRATRRSWPSVLGALGLVGLAFADYYYTYERDPTGGVISNKPSSAWRDASDPTWKFGNQFIADELVSPLLASWNPAWSDEDRKWYQPESGAAQDLGPEDDTTYLSFWWSDEDAAGTFVDQSATSPGYTAGAPPIGFEPETVMLQLWIRDNSDKFDDPDRHATGSPNTAELIVFESHLSRDIANVSTLDKPEPPPTPWLTTAWTANCGAAAHHAFSGDGDFTIACPWGDSDPEYLYDSTGELATDDPDLIDFEAVTRGDVVRYTGNVNHVETFTRDGAGDTWGANTATHPGGGHWSTSSVSTFLAANPIKCKYVKHYAKPSS